MSYLNGYDHPLDDAGVIRLILDEYDRAKAKHGGYTLDGSLSTDTLRLAALVEEVGEVAKLMTYDQVSADVTQLRAELVQVACLAAMWVKSLDGAAVPGT